jgi:poly-gamma-glutamate synthesis protein (capsule biosynthesis protein)
MDAFLAAIVACVLSLASANEVDIVFAGDAMMHTGQLEAAKRGNGIYDYSYCFSAIAPYVKSADYAVVNLETPLAKSPYSGYPQFNAPDSYAVALADAGFDLFLTANNHTLDRRDRGLKRTVATLDSLGLTHIGTYADAADRRKKLPLVVNIRGFKVGFVNYTYGTNGFSVSTDAVVDYIGAKQIHEDIAAVRQAGAEIVVAAMHWGEEYTLTPVAYEKRWAKVLEDEGVDIVMGGHPHVVQPMELRTGSATGKPMFLTYSHGNFISNMMTRDTRGGMLTRVTLARDEKGEAYVKSAAYKLVFTVPPTNSTFQPSPSAGSEPVGKRYGFVRDNYIVMPVDSVPEAWRSRAADFAAATRATFRNHNVGPIPAE